MDATSAVEYKPGRSIQRLRRAIAAWSASAPPRARWSALITNAVSRTSGSAIATRVISRLSTRVLPPASRISPRGAASGDAKKCCRFARTDHCLPSATCTLAARATSVTANSTKKPWTIAVRLGRFISRSRKYDNLLVARDVHSQPPFDTGPKILSARRVPNLRREARALALQSGAPGIEHGKLLGLANADRPSPDDRQRDQDERAE